MDKNEQELCEQVVRLIEAEYRATRTAVSSPEKDGSGPPVELRFKLADLSFAIEHTVIEPFPQAIQTGKEFDELIGPVQALLHGSMPKPGTYRLVFPIHPTQGLHRKQHDAFRAALIAWLRTAAAEMCAEYPVRLDRDHRPSGYSGERRTVIEDVPLILRREVHWSESGRHDGALFPSRVIEGDIEKLRQHRIKTALSKKLPKLAECKALGDVTALVLEFSDVALTNEILVGEALAQALVGWRDWPNHIFIADTTIERPWDLYHVLANGIFSIDMDCIEVGRLVPPGQTP